MTKENGVSPAQAMDALQRILSSRVFVNSNRLSQFLRFTVEETLRGNADQLKEYTIGTTAYGRRPDFDPSHDTIVRTEARRLRRKLKEYYEGDGQHDSVVIFFRSGSYVPVIHSRDAIEGAASRADATQTVTPAPLWKEGDGVWVTVAPFLAQPEDAVALSFAFGLVEEILHRLIGLPGIRVFSEDPHLNSRRREVEGRTDAQAAAFQVCIGGAVRTESKNLRVTSRVTTVDGLVLWSQRYDTETDRESLIDMQEAIASALLNHIAPREPLVMQFVRTPTEALYKLYAEVLMAESFLEEGSIPSTKKALEQFESLKVKAPEYSRLDYGIAQCCIGLAHRGDVAASQLLARAESIGVDLIRRWPELPEAHSILAITHARRRDWVAAEQSFHHALKLGRQHAIHRQFAVYLLVHARYQEAWDHLQIAESIDRFSNRQKTSMGHFFYCSGWHTEARAYYSDGVKPEELQVEPTYFYALTQVEMGERKRALESAVRLERHLASIPTYLTGVAELFALCGEEAKARELIAKGNLLSSETAVSSYRQGCLALALNDVEGALTYFEASLQRSEPELQWIAVEPRFEAIKDHPRYKAIREAVLPA